MAPTAWASFYLEIGGLTKLFPASNLLHERFESRIVAKIVEKWIYFDERNVEPAVVVATPQFVDGWPFLT